MIVLGQTWSIVGVSGHSPMLNDTLMGQTNTGTQRIAIRDDLAPHAERDTVMHELLHVVGCATGHDLEEHQVSAISPVLLDVLRSNASLVAYLTEPIA